MSRTVSLDEPQTAAQSTRAAFTRYHSVAMSTLAVALLASGCLSSGPSLIDNEPRLFLGGGHVRWVDESTVEFEGYLINPTNRTLDFASFGVSGVLVGVEERVITREVSYPEGKGWKPGEARQANVVWRDVPRGAYATETHVVEQISWPYVIPCQTPEGEPASTCLVTQTPRITPATEAEWHDELLACCAWIPPPFDAYDLACKVEGADIVCEFVVLNFTNATEEGRLQLIVTSHGPAAAQEVARKSFEFGEPMKAGEARPYRVVLEGAAADLLGSPATEYKAQIQAARLDLPKSASTEEAPVAFPDAATPALPVISQYEQELSNTFTWEVAHPSPRLLP